MQTEIQNLSTLHVYKFQSLNPFIITSQRRLLKATVRFEVHFPGTVEEQPSTSEGTVNANEYKAITSDQEHSMRIDEPDLSPTGRIFHCHHRTKHQPLHFFLNFFYPQKTSRLMWNQSQPAALFCWCFHLFWRIPALNVHFL